jgi:GT2 family glycosyltransferase
MGTLAVVPTYLTQPRDLDLTLACLVSLRQFQPELEALVVDDGSPADVLVDELEAACVRLQFDIHRKEDNTGFSKTVNVGLARAREAGQNAVLVNADVEFVEPGWLDRMEAQPRRDGEGPADLVGALLLFPNGLIQHAGIFFSLLHRCFDHRFRYAPADLPEAQRAFRCPVTGALQFIRHQALTSIGLYDENFMLGWEDVSYSIEVFKAGGDSIYQPKVRAFHHESMFRRRPSPKLADWQARSWIYFMQKHKHDNFAEYLPTWI